MRADQGSPAPRSTTPGGSRSLALLAGLAGLCIGSGVEVAGATRLALRHELTRSALRPALLVTLVLVAAAIGALKGGWMVDRWSRRTAIRVAATIGLVGAVLAAGAPVDGVIDAGRIVIALAVGALSAAAPVVVADLAPRKARGALVILVPLGAVVGLALAFVVDLVLGGGGAWRVVFGVPIVATAALIVLAGAIPVPAGGADGAAARPPHPWRMVASTAVRPALTLAVVLAVGQQLTGIDVLVGRARSLFDAIGITPDSANVWAAISIGFFSLMAILLARHHIDHDGRRKLLLLGSSALVASLAVLALLALLGGDARSEFVDYAAIPVLWVAVFAFALSLGSTGWVVISEIVPSPVRGMSAGVAYALRWLAALLVALTTRPLADAFGDSVVFGISAVVALGVYLVARRTPETMAMRLPAVAEETAGGEPSGAEPSTPAATPSDPGIGGDPRNN